MVRIRSGLSTARKYINATFATHQTIELSLKAVITQKTGKLPPRVHSLYHLAQQAGYSRASEVVILEPVYVQTRYPETHNLAISEKDVHRFITLAQEVLKWSKSQVM